MLMISFVANLILTLSQVWHVEQEIITHMQSSEYIQVCFVFEYILKSGASLKKLSLSEPNHQFAGLQYRMLINV